MIARGRRLDPASPLTTRSIALIWLALVGLLGALQHCTEAAHAADPEPAPVPPLIRAVPPHVRPPLTVSLPAPERHAQAGDGPMCRELGHAEEEITEAERVTVERQVAACSRRPGRKADVWGLLALWRLEEQLGVPDEARGILGAIYCVEAAAMAGQRRGDWLDGVARAHGPMQLHGWAYQLCGLSDGGRDNLEAAARCYLARVEARAGACGGSWRVAEAMVANAPRYSAWGCAAESKHWQAMEAAR